MSTKENLAIGSMELPILSQEAAKSYVADMLVELCIIAENARLSDLASILQLTIRSVEIQNRS